MSRCHPERAVRRAGATLLAAALVTTVAACGGGGADDAAATSQADTTATTAVAPEPWEDDTQAVLDSAIAPGGIAVNEAGAVADGAVLGVQFPDGRQYVFTTGTDIDGEPVQADGTFLATPLTRTVLDMTVWELAEAGEIDLDAPIAPWAPTIPNADQITLEMLLNRTSGVAESHEELQEALLAGPDRAWSLEESIEVISQVPPVGDPGTFLDLADHGPAIIMGYVLEEETGRPLDELVTEYVTEPLGLQHLSFTAPDLVPTEMGRVVNEDGTSFPIGGDDLNGVAFVTGGAPAWGMQSDMADLLTAFDALVTGTLPGPDQAPRPSAFPPDRVLYDGGERTFGVDTPLLAYCPCTGEGSNRSYSSYGRFGEIAGTSLTYLTFPDTGISMSLRLNAATDEAADLRRVLYEVHDLIDASS